MVETAQNARSMSDVITYWAAKTPDNEVLRYFPQGEEDYQALTYQQFQDRCLSIAEQLKPYKGERALLFFHSGLEFLEALFACFYAQVIAVPAYPPRKNQKLARLQALMDDCSPKIALCAESLQQSTQEICQQLSNCNFDWFATDKIPTQQGLAPNTVDDANSIAFLQYTSGSTGEPKGVMVSHHNLVYNVAMAQNAFALPQHTRCVSWLPLFHDMGLIGAVMMPMFWGAGSWLMPPAAFLQKPIRWLQRISDACQVGPVASAAPNFAYQMCIDHIESEQINQLDFKNWVFALNGAEPVRAQTVDDFYQHFKSAGFSPLTMGPSYGMAECTLLATTRQQKPLSILRYNTDKLAQDILLEDTNSSQQLISSGSSCIEQELLIVEPDSKKVLADNHIGEIWLKGKHIAQGYWNKPTLSQEQFQAFTECGKGPFLRTGDLGCLRNGELFITGRAKDLLIIRGRNYYPHDLEQSCYQASDAIRAGHAAAFTIDNNGAETLAIVAEIDRAHRHDFDGNAICHAIRQGIAVEHSLDVNQIVLIKFASLPKTTSGKTQRYLCKEQLLNNTLNSCFSWQQEVQNASIILGNDVDNADKLLQWLITALANKLQVSSSEIDIKSNLQQLGLDSIHIIELLGQLEDWAGKALGTEQFLLEEPLNTLSNTLITIKQNLHNKEESNNSHDEIEGFL